MSDEILVPSEIESVAPPSLETVAQELALLKMQFSLHRAAILEFCERAAPGLAGDLQALTAAFTAPK